MGPWRELSSLSRGFFREISCSAFSLNCLRESETSTIDHSLVDGLLGGLVLLLYSTVLSVPRYATHREITPVNIAVAGRAREIHVVIVRHEASDWLAAYRGITSSHRSYIKTILKRQIDSHVSHCSYILSPSTLACLNKFYLSEHIWLSIGRLIPWTVYAGVIKKPAKGGYKQALPLHINTAYAPRNAAVCVRQMVKNKSKICFDSTAAGNGLSPTQITSVLAIRTTSRLRALIGLALRQYSIHSLYGLSKYRAIVCLFGSHTLFTI